MRILYAGILEQGPTAAALPGPFLSTQEPFTPMSTSAQIAANQANAQLSTGPKTEEGKLKISLNALKSGLTGRTVLLPSDNVADYQNFLDHFSQTWTPAGLAESNLVQSIVDAEWRLARIPSLERGIFAIGYEELASEGAHAPDDQTRFSIIETKIFLKYERQLTNLSNQANRLRRHRDADIAALKELQTQRKKAAQQQLLQAAAQYAAAVKAGAKNWNPKEFGFEFPMAEIERYARTLHSDAFPRRAA